MIENIFHLLVSLGSEWVLVLLMLLSVGILAIGIERATALARADRLGKSFWAAHTQQWIENGVPVTWAAATDKMPNSAEQKLLKLFRQHPTASAEELDHLSEAVLQSQRLELNKRLSIVGTLGNNAPYIGLLGTVIGIIKAFAALATQNNSASSSLNASLAEALVATAIGIAVALEAVLFFNILTKKSKNIVDRVETLSNLVIGGVKNGQK